MRLPLALFLCLLTSCATVSALITGSTNCTKDLCITGQHDDQTMIDTYTLATPANTPVGWMGLGFGTKMGNSPMIVLWETGGTFQLSHRTAPGNVYPTVDSNPSRPASLQIASSFTNSSSTSITFTVPSTGNATSMMSTPLIYAYSPINPRSSSDAAVITWHSAAGHITLNLLATLDSAPDSASTKSDSTLSPSHHTVLIAHVVCGSLATMLLLPLGVLVQRYVKGLTKSHWWFPFHAIVNGILGAGLIIAAYAIARNNFDKHGSYVTTHRRAGLALFILVLLQVALGVVVHWFPNIRKLQTKGGRDPTNYVHFALGAGIIVLGWVTVWYGLTYDWTIWSQTGAASVGYKAAWGVIVGLFILAYLVGLGVFLPRQRKIERQKQKEKEKEKRSGSSETSPGSSQDNQSDQALTAA